MHSQRNQYSKAVFTACILLFVLTCFAGNSAENEIPMVENNEISLLNKTEAPLSKGEKAPPAADLGDNQFSEKIDVLQSLDLVDLPARTAAAYIATVTEAEVFSPLENDILHTLYTFEVSETLWGEKTARISVEDIGGEDVAREIFMSTPYSRQLQPGQEYLIVLRNNFQERVLPFVRVFTISKETSRLIDERGRILKGFREDGSSIIELTAHEGAPVLIYGYQAVQQVPKPTFIEPDGSSENVLFPLFREIETQKDAVIWEGSVNGLKQLISEKGFFINE